MVQEIFDIVMDQDADEAPLRIRASPAPPTRSTKAQLGDAFIRFAQQTPRKSFERCLTKWVEGRRQGDFPVDDDDPSAESPSPEFVQYLQRRLREARTKR